MRLLIAALICAAALPAMTIQEYDAMPTAARAAAVVGFIDKMTTDLSAKSPRLAQDIRTWFTEQNGKPLPEGMEKLYVELGAIELQAKDGRQDLSKVQLESVIVWVVKQKFQPQTTRQ